MIEAALAVMGTCYIVVWWLFYDLHRMLDDQSRAYRKMRGERNKWKEKYEGVWVSEGRKKKPATTEWVNMGGSK